MDRPRSDQDFVTAHVHRTDRQLLYGFFERRYIDWRGNLTRRS